MSSKCGRNEWESLVEAAEDAIDSDDYEGAAERYRQALALAERFQLGDECLADSLEGFATCRSLADKSADVESIERQASEIRDRLLAKEEASTPPDDAAIAECLDRCASHRLREGRKSEAIRLYERALHARRRAFGDAHFDVANSLTVLASAYSFRDHHCAKTAELWKDAVEILASLFANTETRTWEVVASLTGNLENLAMRAYEHDDRDTAEGLFRRVVEVNSVYFGPEGCVQPLNSPAFARILMHRGEFGEAEGILKADSNDVHLATARRQALIELYETNGRTEDAESLKCEPQ